ncbi:MAG: hypothetical protein V1872_00120 [bacterium]
MKKLPLGIQTFSEIIRGDYIYVLDSDKFLCSRYYNFFYNNFQLFFTLLPILPKSFTNKVIKDKLYLMSFKSPIIINIGIKFFINFISKRGSVYWGIIKSIFYFMRRNIVLKGGFKEG